MKNFFILTLAVSFFALPSEADAQQQPPPGGAPNIKFGGGKDSMRKPLTGFNVLGGGNKKVNKFFTNTKVKQAANGRPSTYMLDARKNAAEAYQQGLDLEKKGKFTEAAQAVQKSINLREEAQIQDPTITTAREKLGDLYLAMGQKDGALGAYQDTLADMAKNYGPGSDHRIKPLIKMANIDVTKADYKAAIDHFTQAYMLTQRSKGVNSVAAMDLRLSLARTHRTSGNLDAAASMFNECIEMQKKDERLIAKNDLIAALEEFADVLKGLHKPDEAKPYLERAEELRKAASPEAAATSAAPVEPAK